MNGRRICFSKKCHRYKEEIVCTREQFFNSHVIKKTTDEVISTLKEIGLKLPFDVLGRYTLLNLFTDLSEKSVAEEILYERFEVK